MEDMAWLAAVAHGKRTARLWPKASGNIGMIWVLYGWGNIRTHREDGPGLLNK